MRLRTRTLLFTFVLALCSGFQFVRADVPPLSSDEVAPRLLTLDDSLSLALSTSPRLGEAQALVERGAFAVDEALAQGMPILGLTGEYLHQEPVPRVTLPFGTLDFAREDSIAGALELRQPVATFGRTRYSFLAADSSLESDRWRFAAVRNDLVRDVRIAYHDVNLSDDAVSVAVEQLALRERQLRQSEALVAEGAAARFDVLSGQADMSRAEQELLAAKRARSLDTDRLLSIVGLQPGTPVVIEEIELPFKPDGTVEEWTSQALSRRPEVLSLDAAVKAQGARANYEAAQNNPRVDLRLQGFQRTETPTLPGSAYAATLQISIPLFDGGFSAARAGQADRGAEVLRKQLEEKRRQVTLEVRDAATDLDNAFERIEVARRNVVHATEALRVAEQRYKNGLSVLVELQSAQTAWSSALLDQVRAQHQVFLTVTRWEWATAQIIPPAEVSP